MVMSTIYQGGRGLASFELHVYIYIYICGSTKLPLEGWICERYKVTVSFFFNCITLSSVFQKCRSFGLAKLFLLVIFVF